jgi:hypothetical protein
MAGHLGRAFEDSLPVYLPILFTKLYVTVKVISSSCDHCISELVARKHTPKLLPALFQGCVDTHSQVRERCAAYLAQYVSQCDTSDKQEALLGTNGGTPGAAPSGASASAVAAAMGHSAELTKAVLELVKDGDGEARKSARQLFSAIEMRWPNMSKAYVFRLSEAACSLFICVSLLLRCNWFCAIACSCKWALSLRR